MDRFDSCRPAMSQSGHQRLSRRKRAFDADSNLLWKSHGQLSNPTRPFMY